MKKFNFLLIITTFFMNAGFAASIGASSSSACASSASSDASSDLNEYGLNRPQQDLYLDGMRAYMERINQTCRYPEMHETRMHLPTDFFELAKMPDRDYVAVTYIKKDVQFSAALDSLLTVPAAGKYIVDCTLATHLARLHGVRSVLADDTLFDKVCNMLSGNASGSGHRKFELTNFIPTGKKHFFSSFFSDDERSALTPGALCYIGQSEDSRDFSFDQGFMFGATPGIEGFLKWGKFVNVYHGKHPYSNFMGLNMIMLDDTSCIFFDPGRTVVPQSVAADLVIEGMDIDLTPWEIRQRSIARDTVPAFNSIKYKNKAEAKVKMLRKAIYLLPKFDEVFACVRSIEKEFVADFVRSRRETGGLEILRALKALTPTSDKYYSILQGAIKDAGSDADVATIVAALELADITV